MTAKEVYLVLNLYTKTKKFFYALREVGKQMKKRDLLGCQKGIIYCDYKRE